MKVQTRRDLQWRATSYGRGKIVLRDMTQTSIRNPNRQELHACRAIAVE